MMKIVLSVLLGFGFGFILMLSEVFHWDRIQEMFHFESFHMFGTLLSAIATAAFSLVLIKKFKLRTAQGNLITLKRKPTKRFGNVFGGLLFGVGWALTGACTAPLFILIGFQWKIGLLVFVGALAGVLLFALIKNKIPQ